MTTIDDEVIAGELVLDEDRTPLLPATLFGTSDPEVALERMAKIAHLLVGVVRDRKLVKRIAGNDYLLAPAWTVLAGMTGLAPYTVWTRRLDDGTGYIARVEARRIADGTVVSAAEQVCARSERKWAQADEHALLGMAQTRAMTRALRGPLMQVVELAGYQGTPAEEMPPQEPKPSSSSAASVDAKPEQVDEVKRLIRRLAELRPDTDWKAQAREITGGGPELMTVTIANTLIAKLRASVEAAEEASGTSSAEPPT
jgi:hypothetical protein